MTKETYNIAWNTFQDHLNERSRHLYQEKFFTDVTLVSDDMVQFQAHRTVLSAASPTFMKLLMINTSANSVLYLKGVHHLELEAILQFIYLGEASVYTDRVEVFVQRSKELNINELNKNSIPEDNVSVFIENQCIQSNDSTPTDTLEDEILKFNDDALGHENMEENGDIQKVEKNNEVQKSFDNSYCNVCDKKFSKKSNLQTHLKSVAHYEKEHQQNQTHELNRNCNVNATAETSQNEFLCKECGKNFSSDYNLKRHIKSVHHNAKYPCNFCGTTYSYPFSLTDHIKKIHDGEKVISKPSDNGNKKTNTSNDKELNIIELENEIANLEEETGFNGKSISNEGDSAIVTGELLENNAKANLDCKKCDKSFTIERNLERHNRSVHEKIRYPCKYCGFKYTQRWSLKYHIKRVHKKFPKQS